MSNQSVTVRVKSVRLLLPLVGVGEFPGGGMLCSPYRVSAVTVPAGGSRVRAATRERSRSHGRGGSAH